MSKITRGEFLNMFRIPKVENPQFYADLAMKSMFEFAGKEKDNIQKRYSKTPSNAKKSKEEINLNKRKDLELEKIRHLNQKVNVQLKKIIRSFPNIKKIDEIYLKLINTSETKVKEIEDALQRLLWITNTIDELTQNTEFKIKKTRSDQTIGFLMKKYLGRVNSYYRKNKSFFEILTKASKFMNSLPTFLDLHTVSIAGFPNVGKSTLMKKMTGSDIEIQNYPFTTKGLMFGYLNHKNNKAIQMIDTPGLLGRTKDNAIEERANIAIQQYAKEIIFVVDLTEECGFSIEQQIKLLKKTTQLNKPTIIYFSKKDLYDEETEEIERDYKNKFKKFKSFEDAKELKKYILENYSKREKKFDPNKIKLIK